MVVLNEYDLDLQHSATINLLDFLALVRCLTCTTQLTHQTTAAGTMTAL